MKETIVPSSAEDWRPAGGNPRFSLRKASSLLHSWRWSRRAFAVAMRWLQADFSRVEAGECLEDSPDRSAWHVRLPEPLGGQDVVYRHYRGDALPLFSRLGESLALRGAQNLEALRGLGIPCEELYACGEIRQVGLLQEAFCITGFIQNMYEGSVFAPVGVLRENRMLRMAFCHRLADQLSKLHWHGARYCPMHGSKFLFPQESTPENMQITWVNPLECSFTPHCESSRYIAEDLITLFVDLRLTTSEIQDVLRHYLQNFPQSGITAEELWKLMIAIPPHSMSR